MVSEALVSMHSAVAQAPKPLWELPHYGSFHPGLSVSIFSDAFCNGGDRSICRDPRDRSSALRFSRYGSATRMETRGDLGCHICSTTVTGECRVAMQGQWLPV
jgi:hypothetical protein